jgi:hypothetical protein
MRTLRMFTLVGLATAVAYADPCQTGSLQNYLNLGTNGCTIAGVSFYSFVYATAETGGASSPSLDSLMVIPRLNDPTVRGGALETGFFITGDWVAAANQTIAYQFGYSFSPIPVSFTDDQHSLLMGWTADEFPYSGTGSHLTLGIDSKVSTKPGF